MIEPLMDRSETTREGAILSETELQGDVAQSADIIYTIGHSNHSAGKLLDLLRQHRIDIVADVRSQPFSRTPEFNRAALERLLADKGHSYTFIGNYLGGRPTDPSYYDAEGHVLYYRLAQDATFLRGIARLVSTARASRIAILCSEEDPARCHRHLLVGRVLAEKGVETLHIRKDGSLETMEETERRLGHRDGQARLLEPIEGTAWKSIQSGLHRKRRGTFSRP